MTEALCTACGDCVAACPKDLFSLHPVSHRLWVACRNLLHGEAAEAECEVACTACGRCEADAPPGLIKIVNNLAVVDYAKNKLATAAPIQRCPTGAIIWIDERRDPSRVRTRRRLRAKLLCPCRKRDLPVWLPTDRARGRAREQGNNWFKFDERKTNISVSRCQAGDGRQHRRHYVRT